LTSFRENGGIISQLIQDKIDTIIKELGAKRGNGIKIICSFEHLEFFKNHFQRFKEVKSIVGSVYFMPFYAHVTGENHNGYSKIVILDYKDFYDREKNELSTYNA